MAARGSTAMQFVAVEVPVSDSLPSNPAVDQIVMYTGVTPYEMLRWTGKGINPTQRRYPVNDFDVGAYIPDISDDHTIGVSVTTVASQAGSGTPSPSNIRAITGKTSTKVKRCGANILNLAAYRSKPSYVFVGNDQIGIVNPTEAGAIIYAGLLRDAKTYTLSASLNGSAAFGVRADLYPDTYQELLNLTAGQTGKVTFTVPAGFEAAGGVLRFYVSGAASGGAALSQIQLVMGSTLPEYQPYAGVDYALTPSAPLYGVTGAVDEIGNDGHETHRTAYLALTGGENWAYNYAYPATDPSLARFTYTFSGVGTNTVGLCSHFPFEALNAGVSHEAVCGHQNGGSLSIFILKSRLYQWSDSDSDAAKAQKFTDWLKARVTAGAPVQIVYQLATPTTVTGVPVAINGVDGINNVTSDGAVMAVSYTGSGWAAAGAVQRVAVESVSITPEQGLRVDTVLTSSDGTQQVPSYFNARGSKYGLFRTSDGMMILGGMVLPNGQPAGVAGALISPGATGETRIEIETASQGSGQSRVDTAALHLVQPSFQGATDSSPAPTGERVPVWFEAVRTTLLNGDRTYTDNYRTAIKALGSMQLIALGDGGEELAWLLVERTPEGGLIHTDGAYSASDSGRTLSNFTPRVQMSAPTGECIVYNAAARRYMLDWKTVEDDYGRFQTFKGGNQLARVAGIVIQQPGSYRFVFHVDMESSGSSGVVLHVDRMPYNWSPPADRDYCLDSDLTERIAYRCEASAPLSASVTTCTLVADLWCEDGDKVLPVVAMATASKTLVSEGTFFTAQKIG